MKNWHLPVEVVVGRGTVCVGHRVSSALAGGDGDVSRSCVFCTCVPFSSAGCCFLWSLSAFADKITHKQMKFILCSDCPSICTHQSHWNRLHFQTSFLAELAVVYFILELSLFSFLSFTYIGFLIYLLSPYQIDFHTQSTSRGVESSLRF